MLPATRQSRVFIVDDDTQTLRAFERLLLFEGFAVDTFTSASDFLRRPMSDVPCCLILDLNLPGVDGLRLQKAMRHAAVQMPIVFVSGCADVSATASAMRYGAVDFLEKPVDDARLIDAVTRAVKQDATERIRQDELMRARERMMRLTPREREVCDLVASGLINKQIASVLGASHRTVKIHRHRVMQKLEVSSVADIVRLLARLEERSEAFLSPPPDRGMS